MAAATAGYVPPDSVKPGASKDATGPTPGELAEAKAHAVRALGLLMDTTVPQDAICALWMGSLTYAYGFEKGARANEIAGRYVKRFDERGLHPASVAWGAIHACESLIPELALEGVACTPRALRDAAREDAWTDHLHGLGVA